MIRQSAEAYGSAHNNNNDARPMNIGIRKKLNNTVLLCQDHTQANAK